MFKQLIILSLAVLVSQSSLSAKTYSGRISIDGSSTVFPISEAVAEEARSNAELRKLRVGVNFSGTGGGFKKFCNGELDITGASRPIKRVEREACKKAGVEFIELPVAFDGIAVVANKKNKCATSLTTAELKRIWEPAAKGKITSWNQIKPECDDIPLKLYGPGLDSGTFDYFTEVIVGKSKSSRPDFTKSEDDNVLVNGIEGDVGSLGYFGFAYYTENQSKLRLIKVDNGAGPVAASAKTIADGSYEPLSRPVFIYVSKKSAKRPEVKRFVEFYIDQAAELSPAVGYVALAPRGQGLYKMVQKRFESLKTGSIYTNTEGSRVILEDALRN